MSIIDSRRLYITNEWAGQRIFTISHIDYVEGEKWCLSDQYDEYYKLWWRRCRFVRFIGNAYGLAQIIAA